MSHPAGPPTPPWPGGPPQGAAAVCVRHPDRPTGLSCTRCGRPACPDCLREASVGYQCVDCVGEGNRGVRRAVTIAGAQPGGRPLVAPTLVALNVAVFAWTVATSGSVSRNDRAPLFQQWALVPGAVADGEWWRVITGGFLHFGPIHLLFNMMALWVIGRDIEPALGRVAVPGRLPGLAARRVGGGDAAVGAQRATSRGRRERCSASWGRSRCSCVGCGSPWARWAGSSWSIS